MAGIGHDFRFALRQLLRSPGFTAAAVATLALGIGANTAMFTVIDSVLLRPLPYRNADRLMTIGEKSTQEDIGSTSWLNWQDLRRESKSFEDIGGYVIDVAIVQGAQGGETTLGTKLTCNMLHVLGAEPRLGRGFNEADCQPGAAPTVLLSDGIWRRNFGADPNVIGKQARVGDVPHLVVGVMPAGFAFPDEARAEATKGIWLPSQPTQDMKGRGFTLYSLLGRLRPGIRARQANAELATIAADIRKLDPKAPKLRFAERPYRETVTGSMRPVFLALSAALGLVLLIACANVANLQLSRCLARYHELAVRAALGAPKWRLMRELMAEGAALSVIGSLAGLEVALGILDAVRALPEDMIPRAGEIHLRLGVIAALAVLAGLATVLSSVVPAMFAMKAEPQAVLRGAGRGVSPRAARSRMAAWLVTGEVAVAAVLLVACSLLFRTLYNLEHKTLGFDVENVVSFTATPPNSAGYLSGFQRSRAAQPPIATQVYEPILQQLREIPGVECAALSSSIPFDGVDMRTSFELNGRKETEEQEQNRHAEIRVTSGQYMRAMRTPMIRGRAISDDDIEGRPFVAVVNQAFAREYLRGIDALGQRLSLGGEETGMAQPYTVVGVEADAVQKSASARALPELILSYRQIPEKSLFYPLLVASATNYVLRTRAHEAMTTEVHAVFHKMAPGFAIDNLRSMQKTVEASTFNQRLSVYLVGSFAGVAILMVMIGLYGVLSQSVSQRKQEIGVRMALGATSESILALILGRGSVLIAAGLVIGFAAALGASRMIVSFLYGVHPMDVWSYAGAAAALALIGLIAAAVPARRAAAIEPMEALRSE